MQKALTLLIMLPVICFGQIPLNTTPQANQLAQRISIYFVPSSTVSETKAFTVNSSSLVTCQSMAISELRTSNATSLADFVELMVGCGTLKAQVNQDSVSAIINRIADTRSPNWPFAIVIFDDRNGISESLKRDLVAKGYMAQDKDEIEPRFVPFRTTTTSQNTLTYPDGTLAGTSTMHVSENTPENIRNASLNANYSGFFVVGVKYWGEMEHTTNMYVEDIAEAMRPTSPRYLVPR